jgi:5'-nucleotidase
MRILLTNDDGIDSSGLQELRKALEHRHEVWTFAPNGERSGTSHSISLKEAVRVRKEGERSFSCSGSPADCVLFSFLGAIPIRPDLVISGINKGPNIGTDIIYSGTAAAAREAALRGLPGIAISLATKTPPFRFQPATDFVLENLELLVTLWSPEHFININVPVTLNGGSEVEITHPSRRFYKDNLIHFNAPDGDVYYFLDGAKPDADGERNSDWRVLSRGNISVTPVYLHPIDHNEEIAYQSAKFVMPAL